MCDAILVPASSCFSRSCVVKMPIRSCLQVSCGGCFMSCRVQGTSLAPKHEFVIPSSFLRRLPSRLRESCGR